MIRSRASFFHIGQVALAASGSLVLPAAFEWPRPKTTKRGPGPLDPTKYVLANYSHYTNKRYNAREGYHFDGEIIAFSTGRL